MMTREQYARMCEQQDAAELAWGLELIDRLPRRELLHLLDRDSARENSDRLRRKTRLRWIEGLLHSSDLYQAQLAK